MLTRFTADLSKGQGLVTFSVVIGGTSLHWSLRLRRIREDLLPSSQGISSGFGKLEESLKKLGLYERYQKYWTELMGE